jgi:hypothetical protein
MKKFLYLFFAFALVAMRSCEKDPKPTPDPGPDPNLNPTVEIQVEFQNKPDNMKLDCIQLLVVDAERVAGIKAIEFKYPISTVRFAGDEAKALVGKKVYIYVQISRIYPPNSGSLIMQKAIHSLVPLSGINKIVVVISPDITVPQEEIDP